MKRLEAYPVRSFPAVELEGAVRTLINQGPDADGDGPTRLLFRAMPQSAERPMRPIPAAGSEEAGHLYLGGENVVLWRLPDAGPPATGARRQTRRLLSDPAAGQVMLPIKSPPLPERLRFLF